MAMTSEDFDRIASDARQRAELYRQYGMDGSAAAAEVVTEKAQVAAATYRRNH